jgi:predicted nucleotidyltransferase component of viral defense system
MEIPLAKRLKKKIHREIGYLQDEAIELIYSVQPQAVLHGGTELWRCFGGTRFSDDIDLYFKTLPEAFQTEFREKLESRGLRMGKFKITGNTAFCMISGEQDIKVQIHIGKPPASDTMNYERMDGTSLIIRAVPIDELIVEKAEAYLSRKKIRDAYDVFFLAQSHKFRTETERKLGELIAKFQSPVDEGDLQTIIYAGAVPKFVEMMKYLKGRFR